MKALTRVMIGSIILVLTACGTIARQNKRIVESADNTEDKLNAKAVVANNFLVLMNPKLASNIVLLEGDLGSELWELLDVDVQKTVIKQKESSKIWKIDDEGKIVLKDSGRHIRLVNLKIKQASKYNVTIIASWAAGNLNESIYTYEIEKRGGSWQIVKWGLSGMS